MFKQSKIFGIILVVILCLLLNSSFSYFMLNTHLGKLIMLSIVIIVTICSTALGIIGVFIIMTSYNNSNIEGFDPALPALPALPTPVGTKLSKKPLESISSTIPTTPAQKTTSEHFTIRSIIDKMLTTEKNIRGKSSKQLHAPYNNNKKGKEPSANVEGFTSPYAAVGGYYKF